MHESETPLYGESCFAEAITADDSPIIKNVLLCGNSSRNGYSIPATAFGGESRAKQLYEGKPVFLDHAPRGRELARSVREMAGVVTNVRFSEGKPYGDIDTEAYPSGGELLSLARKRPRGIGMSHIAEYTMSRDRKCVQRVDDVVSVDVVFRPATTNTFFERNEGESKVDLETLKEELATVRQERDAARDQVNSLKTENEQLKASAAESQGKVTELNRENADLKSKVDAHEARLALEQRQTAIESELKEAGLDPADKTVCSELFIASLKAEGESEARKALIADRKAILGDRTPAPRSQERKDPTPKAFDPAKYHEGVKSDLFNGYKE